MMCALARSSCSRLLSIISRNNNRRFSSAVTSGPPKEAIISSSILGDQPPPPPTGPPPPPPASGIDKNSWSVLKYGLTAAITGGAATAGYATYAYSLDEVDEKTKAIRASANFNVGDDGSSFDVRRTTPLFFAFSYLFVLTMPAKLVEAYLDLRRLAEEHVRGFTEPTSDKLLPDLHPMEQHVFTIVLDLNETLIYSDWKRDRGWRTFKRPGVDAFLEHLAQFYEIVVYSDQLNMYVDPVAERLDPKHCIRYRLSRGATRYIDGKHYRDLSMLNRDPAKVLYISGNALESSLQRENCVPIKAWQGEADDTALLDLIPFLEYVAKHRPSDIRTVLASYQGRDIAKEFIERSKEHQRRMQEQKQQGRLWRR
ncbi:Mitochondrial import inner membrane translocase subunit TIM50 [Striga hermonthica]|uniref:Mitochondrial import inner membrane translocase subunit TIM50 n=1 Tax=Striga hermonthica TaxID=68872 RepID=A0A9N7NNI9_STRHE|nr:Mitochondrial import inner membrane translocase subunit TIM50 [Striga hermonthica]